MPATAVGNITPSALAATTVTLFMLDTNAVAVPCVDPAALTAALMLSIIIPFIVVLLVAPDTAEPMLMLVVEPETPAVPMLTVLVVPLVVAPVPRFRVCAPVDWPTVIVPVWDVPPRVKVPVVWLVPIDMLLVVVEKVTAADPVKVEVTLNVLAAVKLP